MVCSSIITNVPSGGVIDNGEAVYVGGSREHVGDRSEFNEPGELNVIYSHFFIFIYIYISSSVIKVRETSGGLLFMLWHLTSIRGITHSMRCGGRVTGDIHWWFFRLMDVKMAPRGKRQTKPW